MRVPLSEYLLTVATALFRFQGVEGLGLGDVKFLAAAGIWVGIAGLPMLLLVATLTAMAGSGIIQLAGQRLTGQTSLTFGPFLAVGLLFTGLRLLNLPHGMIVVGHATAEPAMTMMNSRLRIEPPSERTWRPRAPTSENDPERHAARLPGDGAECYRLPSVSTRE